MGSFVCLPGLSGLSFGPVGLGGSVFVACWFTEGLGAWIEVSGVKSYNLSGAGCLGDSGFARDREYGLDLSNQALAKTPAGAYTAGILIR